MSQIRFNIGVPRGGSAARSVEDGSEARVQSVRPQGGSAARAAEERNRLDGVPARRGVSIGLRAQGGRSAEDVTGTARATPATATVVRREPLSVPPMISGSQALPAAPLSADAPAEEHVSFQPPQTVVARLQSLAKSLFSPGGSSTKPS